MHIQSYPLSYNNPDWERVFLSIEDTQVDAACQAWFEQWCAVPDLYIDNEKRFFECLPALHALSNRNTAPLDGFLERFDNADDILHKEVGYVQARVLFTATIAAVGWEGFAIRCATDPRGYAGYMQHIEKNSLYAHIDDLANQPHAGKKLKEALDLYGADLRYPWIGAACISWAVFGKNTSIEDLPLSVQWIKTRYTKRQETPHWGTREMLGEPVDFAENADVIKALLQSPELWNHMLLQADAWGDSKKMLWLWLHWAESIGYNCKKEQQLFENREYQALSNCVLKGDNTELELMRLMEPRAYLLQKAQSHHNKALEKFELPGGLESSSPNI